MASPLKGKTDSCKSDNNNNNSRNNNKQRRLDKISKSPKFEDEGRNGTGDDDSRSSETDLGNSRVKSREQRIISEGTLSDSTDIEGEDVIAVDEDDDRCSDETNQQSTETETGSGGRCMNKDKRRAKDSMKWSTAADDERSSSNKRPNVFKNIIDRLARRNVEVENGRQDIASNSSQNIRESHSKKPSFSQRQQLSYLPSRTPTPHSPDLSLNKDSSSALNLSLLFREVSTDAEMMEPRKSSGKKSSANDEPSNTVLDSGKSKHGDSCSTQQGGSQTKHSVKITNENITAVCLDLEKEERALSPDRKLNTIKKKYYTSLDYLRKVQIVSKNLDKERENLRLRRKALHQVLHRLRFIYNVTRIRHSKNSALLDQNALTTLWNLSKFDDSVRRPESNHCQSKPFEGQMWSESSIGRLPLGCSSSISHCSSSECEILPCKSDEDDDDDDREESETGSPMETSVGCSLDMEEHHGRAASVPGDLVHQGLLHCIPSHQRGLCEVAKPIHADSNPNHSYTKVTTNITTRSPVHASESSAATSHTATGSAVNSFKAHGSSNRLDVRVGHTPVEAHVTKRDLSNFTYLYCNTGS